MTVKDRKRTGPATQDSLAAYNEKRDFTRTNEPRGEPAAVAGFEFVIQKHDARRLHYDLRLELDGVLKSWAVTRGPSLVPGQKRLAVHTEDHPMKYLEFEGVIPQGEYGGGSMIVWDRGRWIPDGDPHKGYAKGRLDFHLEGSRLQGGWHLVRMKPRRGEKAEQWLLIKAQDEHARGEGDADILEEQQTSFLSGRTNAQLAEGGDLRKDHAVRQAKRQKAPAAPRLKGAKKGLMPVFVEPALATLHASPPSGGEWLHEIKYDGYRIQARIDGDEVKLLTRKGLDWTARFEGIAAALRSAGLPSAILDGEIVVEDDAGISSFGALQQALKAGRPDGMAYYVFDLLYHDGRDLRGVPLERRKALLATLIPPQPEPSGPLRFTEHIDFDGETILRHACRLGLEGIISKRLDTPYRSGRHEDWLKAKCVQRQEFVILGYLPSTAVKAAVGSLALGYGEGGRLVYAGRVGTGLSQEESTALLARLRGMAAEKPDFLRKPPAGFDKGVHWVEPSLVAEIEFRGWTPDGLLRQASFQGMRDDKDATEIVREETAPVAQPEPAGSDASGSDDKPVVAGVTLTHPDRVLWSEAGVTKRGLADYYASIADWILPQLVDRPLSLVRCPSGAGAQCFFQKHAWAGLSKAVREVDVGDKEPMLAISDLSGLIGLVQAGVLEIHPWGSRLDDLERPDRLIFDLDPGEGTGYDAVIDGALAVRRHLEGLGLRSFVKTSGGKGLHVVLPLRPAAGWDAAKAFAKQVAEDIAAAQPDRYLSKMSKAARKGRIFIDWLRNGRGATAVAAYSTRARPGAPVSVPLGWDELSETIAPNHYTVENLPQRLRYLDSDPWAEFAGLQQALPQPPAKRKRS